MKTALGFDKFLTPKVLVLLYWLSMLFILIGGILTLSHTNLFFGILGIIGALIGCRVGFELVMIAFKNNEYLHRIAENLPTPKE